MKMPPQSCILLKSKSLVRICIIKVDIRSWIYKFNNWGGVLIRNLYSLIIVYLGCEYIIKVYNDS